MTRKSNQGQEHTECQSWEDVTAWFEDFPTPTLSFDPEGEICTTNWAFRGVSNSNFDLEPSIERVAGDKSIQWAALEKLVASEFRSRAGGYLPPSLRPQDELSWLSIMQHYGVPTRLLDFTYSPYIALYFASRKNAGGCSGKHIRIYALDETALNSQFRIVAYRSANSKHEVLKPDVYTLATDKDNVTDEIDGLRGLISDSLAAEGERRWNLNDKGCVCAATPGAFNSRLASQQGVFLFSCAEELTLRKSLDKMMDGQAGWQRTADIPIGLAQDAERRLFRMNIHAQSLFPDLEGLAGFIQQKIDLSWR